MRLLYILDKSPLSPDADVEQAVNTASALAQAGAEVELVFPWYKKQEPLKPEDLIKRYGLSRCPELNAVPLGFKSTLAQQFVVFLGLFFISSWPPIGFAKAKSACGYFLI